MFLEMIKTVNFTSVKVRQLQDCLNKAVKIFQEPTERRKRTPNLGGFCRLRLSGSPNDLTFTMVASPTQGQKTRLISPNKLADKVGTHTLLNSFKWAFTDLLPGKEPKLYYTVTSFDAIKVRVSQFSVGGRGLTYFLLTYCLPFLILCNSKLNPNPMDTKKNTLEYWKSQLDEIWLEQMKMIHKGKNMDEIIGYAFADLISQPERLERANASDFKRLVNGWLSNRKPEQKKGVRIDLKNI